MVERSYPGSDIAKRLIDRADAHDRMALGNGAQYLGFYSTWDARLMRDAAEAIHAVAQAPGDASYWKEQHKVAVQKHIECCGPCRNCGAPIDEVFCGTCREMGCTLPSTQCATCHDRGYVVEDGDWEPIAIQCPTCAHSSPDKSGAA